MRWAGLFEAYVELIQTLEAYRTEGKPIRQSSVSFEQVPRCNTENRTPQPPSLWLANVLQPETRDGQPRLSGVLTNSRR